jgi:hypothetical protein
MNSISPALAAADGLAEPWAGILVAALVANGVALAGYRYYRFTKGGPAPDAIGGAVLGALLVLVAALVLNDVSWSRWVALAYALFFGLIVMPIWTLAVLIPLPPGPLDYAFTVLYEATLIGIAIAALAA